MAIILHHLNFTCIPPAFLQFWSHKEVNTRNNHILVVYRGTICLIYDDECIDETAWSISAIFIASVMKGSAKRICFTWASITVNEPSRPCGTWNIICWINDVELVILQEIILCREWMTKMYDSWIHCSVGISEATSANINFFFCWSNFRLCGLPLR